MSTSKEKARSGPSGSQRLVLEAVATPASVDQVAQHAGLSRSTAHRRLTALVARGLVELVEEGYLRTEAGRLALEQGLAPAFPPSYLAKIWPFLKEMPSLLHASVLVLVIAAFVARRDRLNPDSNPGFILAGATQRLKSWLCRLLCSLLGEDPKECEVLMPEIRGRGLLARLDGQGDLQSVCPSLERKLLWINEASRTEAGVRRDMMTLLNGTTTVSIEKNRIEVAAVPVVEMNFVKEAGSLPQRLGLDPAIIRRALVADFSSLTLTPKDRLDAKELAQRILAVGPFELPAAPTVELSRSQSERVLETLDACVLPQARDMYDPGRVFTLVQGLRAFLAEEEAVVEALHAVFVLYESTGFLRPNWRSVMAMKFMSPGSLAMAKPAQPESQPREENQMATHEPAKPRPLNPFLLDDLLIQVVTALQQSGLEIHDNANAVATLARLLQAYADQGGTAEELLAIRNDLPELKEVNRVRRQLKLQFDEVRRVRELATALDLYGIPEGEVAAFLGFWKRMKELNFDPAWLSALAEELARQHQANPQAVDALIKLALKGEGFEAQVNETHEHYQRIDNYCRERRSDLQELEEQQRNYARNVAELKKERDELVLEVRVRELQLAELDKLVAGRKGQLALLAGGEGGASK